ncbi:13027_t:CDS:1, partial [Entrophospora sp. SA101]
MDELELKCDAYSNIKKDLIVVFYSVVAKQNYYDGEGETVGLTSTSNCQ